MSFLPKMDEFYICSSHFNKADSRAPIERESVGGKSFGLLSYVEKQTLPFITIKSNLYDIWCETPEKAINILSDVLKDVLDLFTSLDIKSFIVRSSAKIETYKERGNYFSSKGNILPEYLQTTVIDIWTQNKSICSEFEGNTFAIIIQQYIQPSLFGHLSNERRISRNINICLVEYYDRNGVFSVSKRFKTKTKNDDIDIYEVRNAKELKRNLEFLPYSFIQDTKRFHIEWIWDGKKIWLVQCDLEEDSDLGTEPGNEWIKKTIISKREHFSVLKRLSSITNHKWSKTKCVQTFIDLKLPFGEIYILDNPNVLKDLANGVLSNELLDELEWLLEYPIVIRTDIDTSQEYARVLLPRTDSVFTIEETTDILIKQSKYFHSENIGYEDFCFLIHRFILSKSCALAFAKPNIPKTRIDSTWGIVDGLYYHPHDSFEVSITDEKIKKQIRCKSEYLDVKENGVWFSKKSGVNFDWKESLTKKELLNIAHFTTKIADKLDTAVTVMFFVGIDCNTGYEKILPWFYTTDEITGSSEKFSDSIFSNDYILIETKDDLDEFKNKVLLENKKHTIKLRPNAEIIRDKKIVEEIATIAKENNIPVQLEGSILAHPYYILRKNGVKVKCVNYFDPQYSPKNFYKLVRDKIPVNIESKGENARIIKIEPKQLLRFLKEKAIEEALEFYWEKEEDSIIEELADLYEIIRSSCNVFSISINEIEKIADKKVQSKGDFSAGIILLNTTESSLIDIIDREKNQLFEIGTIDRRMIKSSTENKHKVFFESSTLKIPYMHNISKSLKIPENILNSRLIEVSYHKRNIEIKFIKEKKQEDLLQLKIEFPENQQ